MPVKNQYRYITSQTDQLGRTYVYFRRGAQRIRLPAQIGSEEFLAAYAAALKGSPLTAVSREKRTREPLIGVYLLIMGGQVIYVGSSLHMPRRVAAHRSNGRSFDQVFYIRTPADQREVLERLLIRQLDPQQNRQGRDPGPLVRPVGLSNGGNGGQNAPLK